ncbi:MAG: DUF3102 domain-containing protein [Xenococcus sp. (in: cyanobacteria)]
MILQSENNINEVKISFDYKILSSQKQIIIKQCTGEIKKRLRRTAQDIWEIGKKITEVRSQLEHGQFEVWLRSEFGWSRRTAYNFINVYETFSDSKNFAQLDIATSALYKLAAPSTPQSIRQQFLSKAEQGEKITHKKITEALKTTKKSQVIDPPQPSSSPVQEVLQVNRQPRTEPDLEKSLPSVMNHTQVEIKPNCWYLFDLINVLFSGDTALAEFCLRAPEATLALAITSDDWDHDWLIEKASNVIVLKESYLRPGLIEQTIALYSEAGDTVIFPWLPDAEMLEIAKRLKRRIFAGDPNLQRCQKAIAKLEITPEELTLGS